MPAAGERGVLHAGRSTGGGVGARPAAQLHLIPAVFVILSYFDEKLCLLIVRPLLVIVNFDRVEGAPDAPLTGPIASPRRRVQRDKGRDEWLCIVRASVVAWTLRGGVASDQRTDSPPLFDHCCPIAAPITAYVALFPSDWRRESARSGRTNV